jgi:hypothetical protein
MYALMYFYGLPLLASAAAMTRISLLVTGAAVVSFIAKGAVMYSVAVPLALALGWAAGGGRRADWRTGGLADWRARCWRGAAEAGAYDGSF